MMAESGSVFVVGSIVGLFGRRGQCAYSASKAALVALVQTAAREWAVRESGSTWFCPGTCRERACRPISCRRRARSRGFASPSRFFVAGGGGLVHRGSFPELSGRDGADLQPGQPDSGSLVRGRVLFVGGTDTGVGKTVVSAAITALARRDGLDAVAMKPVETGCPGRPGKRRPIDGRFLRLAGGSVLSEGEISPVTLGRPAAPSVAARIERRSINLPDLKKVDREARAAPRSRRRGRGGRPARPDDRPELADRFRDLLGCPLLLVGRTALGAVNQMLLSLDAARTRKIPVVGWLLNHSGGRFGLAERTAASEIAASRTSFFWASFLPSEA